MNNGEIIEVGNHNELIKKPNGAYARLCTAQKIREETEETRAAEDNPGLDEKVILDDEKIIPPEDLDPLGALKRSATGKSAVSSILSRKRQEDAARRAKNYGFFYLFWRMGKLNREEWPSYILGLFAAAVSGMVYPVAFPSSRLSTFAHLRFVRCLELFLPTQLGFSVYLVSIV